MRAVWLLLTFVLLSTYRPRALADHRRGER